VAFDTLHQLDCERYTGKVLSFGPEALGQTEVFGGGSNSCRDWVTLEFLETVRAVVAARRSFGRSRGKKGGQGAVGGVLRS